MRSVRSAIALAAVWFGCSEAVTPPKPDFGEPNEIFLKATDELPRFHIRATFVVGVDPRPHIQPVTAALVAARAVCCIESGPVKPGATAALSLDVRGRLIHAESRNPTGACFARAMDGKSIDDAASYVVELLVSVG